MKPSHADQLLLVCLCMFFLTTGAVLWETVLFVPAWSRAAPASFRVFAAPYSIDPGVFWGVAHSAFELGLVIAIVANWRRRERRLPLLSIAALYAVTRVWTLAYFAPTFIHFQATPVSNTIDESLTQLTTRWRELSAVRTTLVIADNLLMLWFCSRALLRDVSASAAARATVRL
jgi:hypothetical protein